MGQETEQKVCEQRYESGNRTGEFQKASENRKQMKRIVNGKTSQETGKKTREFQAER
jgi:hypothetical protein